MPLLASSTEVAVGSVTVFPLALLAIATGLQGCSVASVSGSVASVANIYHGTAAWETKPSYFTDFAFIPEGRPVSEAVLNSCSVPGLPKEKQCSGNGVCREWNSTTKQRRPLRFCVCDTAYADPECRTLRKSQTKAFVLSVFVGYLGFDRFYLGEYFTGIAKLSTLGGFGTWWIYDIVRIGSAPVYATDYRVASDLPHVAYVVSVVLYAATLGYLVFGVGAAVQRRQQAKAQMLRKAEGAFIRSASATVNIDPADTVGEPILAGNYGYPIQVHVGYGAIPGHHPALATQPFVGYSGRLGS